MDNVEKLVVDNMGLVYMQLHKFKRAYDADAFSYAMEALLSAARTFDASKNTKFSTYASVCIYNGIANYMRTIQKDQRYQMLSLSDVLEGTNNVTLMDTLMDVYTPEQHCIDEELRSTLWKSYDIVMSRIKNPVELRVIEYWRESDFTSTQQELANKLNVSQAHVSRILSAFKYQLRKEMEKYLC